MPIEIINIKDMTNQQFVEQYAKPGCIGLVGADTLIDNSIKKVQKYITADGKNSLWSHALIYTGKRSDGQWWVIESDLEFHKKQIKLGVQENRAAKYYDKRTFPNMAILDFGLSEEMQHKIIGEGLNLVNDKAQYSVREVFGALFNFKGSRAGENLLAQENSFFCSAMVQHCYSQLNMTLAEGISLKNLAPEDIATTNIQHTQYRIVRSEK